MVNRTGWRSVPIAQLGKIITGKTPPTSREELFGADYPFITPTDVPSDNKFVQTNRYLSEEGRAYQERLMLPPRAVCFTCIGATIGKICVTTNSSFTNQQINSIIVDETDHDPDFVYYLLKYNAPKIKGVAGGAATPIVSKSAFSEIDVDVPPLPTQRKIAAILSAYDDLIENNTRRIKILEEMTRLIYREWFVNFRFPGHEKVKMVKTKLGQVPEGWEIKRLGEVADVNASNIEKGSEPNEINYVDIASVSTGQIDSITPMAFANAPGRARRIVSHGDIIWSSVRPNRKSYSLIINPLPNLIVSTGFTVLTARSVPYTYLYHAVTTDDFVGYLTNHATGAAYPAVNADDFKNATIVVPSQELLSLFHNIVADMFNQRENLQRKNANLRRTRDLLLPKLIAGEVEVEGLEIAVE